jgi:hypothetical protein
MLQLRPCIAAIASLMLVLLLAGCGGESAAEAVLETVCVDTKSRQIVLVSGVDQFPAVNSETGRPTLMPGMYCPKCQTWHVAPPVEQLQRQKGVAHCPKSGTALVLDGPRPADARKQP